MIGNRKPVTTTSRRVICLAIVLYVSQGVTSSQTPLTDREVQRIEDPSGQAMVGFYESLARASHGEWVTRILHYGDSHVAADILTGTLRRQFQLSFGEAGAGFVLPGRPWPGYTRPGVSSKTSAGWRVEGLTQRSLAADGRLGLAGVSFSTSASGEWITVTAEGDYFDIYVLKQPGGGSISVSLDGVEKKRNLSLASELNESASIQIVADIGVAHTLQIRTTSVGRTRIFGIAVERNRAGVIYDALGINGARASRPLGWDWEILAGGLELRDPDLIVVSYGSNEVSDWDLDLEEYRVSFNKLLQTFQEAAPRASILVIGPPDRAVRIGHRWKPIGRMPALVRAQRLAAFDARAAFYDLFKAMGGLGSVERWATQPKPLAQPDRVHLTSAGYKLVAGWLYSELINGYVQTVSDGPGPTSRQEPAQ